MVNMVVPLSMSTLGLPVDPVAASAKNVPPVLETGAMLMAKAGSAVDAPLMEQMSFD
jgi:hypothetical protein